MSKLFVSPTGTKYSLKDRQDVIYEVLQQTGYFEMQLVNMSIDHLLNNPNTTVIDVGANIGTYCLEIAQAFPDLPIYAFEPLVGAYNELIENIQLNQFTNILPRKLALGAVSGSIEGEVPRDDQAYGHISLSKEANIARGTDYDCDKTIYAVSALDDFNFENVSLIKIDVEGMELEVLQGAVDTLERCSPMIMFEAWDRDWYAKQRTELLEFVQSIGYTNLLIMGENIIATK